MAKPGLEPSAEINGGAASVIIFPAISEGVPYASPSELTLGCGHDGYLRYQSGRIAVPPVPLVEVHIDGQALDLPARWEIKESLRKSVVLQLRLTEEEQRAVVEALKGGQRLSVRAGGGSPEEVFDLRTNGSLCR